MDPLTLALVASAVGAAGSLAAGAQQAAATEAQGKIAENQAKFEAAQSRRQSDRLLASQRAGFAKAGVQLVGSPLLVVADSAVQAELEEEAILRGGRGSRAVKSAEASAIRTGSIAKAGSGLLSGIATFKGA